jgi:PAS domain S-box-containing protein
MVNDDNAANKRKNILEAVNEIFLKTLTCETDEEVAKTCLSVVERITNSKFGFIAEVNERGNFDTIAISNPGWEACTIPEDEAGQLLGSDLPIRGIRALPIKENRSFVINDSPMTHDSSVPIPNGHPEITSFLGVPLRGNAHATGLVALANKDGGYTDEDRENVEILAVAIIQALQNKRAQKNLVRSNKQLKSIFDTVQIGILIIDPKNKRIVDANPKACIILGRKREDILNKLCYDFFVCDEHEVCDAKVDVCVEDAECELIRLDGSRAHIMRTITSVIWSNKVYLVENILDITVQKQEEQKLVVCLDKAEKMLAANVNRLKNGGA